MTAIILRKYPNNPLTIPSYGAEGVVHPDILYFSKKLDGYKFWLYYTPYPPDEREVPCLVRSNDGLNFFDIEVSNPLINRGGKGAWDEKWCADPDVVKIDNDWYLFYFGADKWYTHGAIGLATSEDGKNWSKKSIPILIPSEVWEGNYIAQPTVIYHDDKFWMWYVGCGTFEIGLATSEDAINWIRVQKTPVMKRGKRRSIFGRKFDSSRVLHPDVSLIADKYWMFYCGSANGVYKLGVAWSENGINWRKHEGNPILTPLGKGWEQRYIYRSSQAIVDNRIWLYYSAFAGRGPPARPKIGLAWLEYF